MLFRWYSMEIAQWYLGNLDIIWSTNTKNTICLTIDDAIYSNSFEEILNILDKFDVKATFFVISSYVNDKNYNLLLKAIENGHHLANHGTQNKAHALFTASNLENDIILCEQVLRQLYKDAFTEYPKIKYFRPGCGYTTDTISYVCKKLGYKIVLGTVYPVDSFIPMPNIYSLIIKNKVKSGDIIILHDRWWTPSTLLKILPDLKTKYKIIHLLDC